MIVALIVGGVIAWRAIDNSSQLISDFNGNIDVVLTEGAVPDVVSVGLDSGQQRSEGDLEPATFSSLGFSAVLPDGVSAGTASQSEGGPYQYILFSDGTNVNVTSNLDFDDQFGAFPSAAPTQNIGNYTFFVQDNGDGSFLYGLESDGKRYQIYQASGAQIDLATFNVL